MHYRLPHLGQGILGPALVIYASKPTTLSSAFRTTPLEDPTWHMDTARVIYIQLPSCQLLLLLFSRQVIPRGINASDIQDPNWRNAMSDEYNALVKNGTWLLVPRPAASCPALLQQIIGSLNNEFDMTDLVALNYFLGIFVDRTPTGLFLSQKKYALQLLQLAHMATCNPSQAHVDTESRLGPKVQHICLYMHDPREPHLAALKRILRYVKLRNLLRELHSLLSTATLVYCDNVSAIYMAANHVQHQRRKHIEIDIHFVRDMVIASQASLRRNLIASLCIFDSIIA
uniref:Uncharacterized protein n=1 Tax=Tanacetum cinerariifolium TaxID=118510 RepID=A0A6L2LCV4_TANCI|nr:hypothetical protein [Tanacetum cinerariifolium]